jgi:hypothetical protein
VRDSPEADEIEADIPDHIRMPHAIDNAPHSLMRARGEKAGAGLTVFEMKALGAVLVDAKTRGLKEARHEFSLQGGRPAIDRFRERVKAKKAFSKPIGGRKYDRRYMRELITEGIKAAGSDAYRRA